MDRVIIAIPVMCWVLAIIFAIVGFTIDPGAFNAAIGCGIGAAMWTMFAVVALSGLDSGKDSR